MTQTTQDTAADAYRHAAAMAAALAAKARYGFTHGPAWVRAEYVQNLADQLSALANHRLDDGSPTTVPTVADARLATQATQSRVGPGGHPITPPSTRRST